MSLLQVTANTFSFDLFQAIQSISPSEAIFIIDLWVDVSTFHTSKLLSIEVDAIQLRFSGDHLASLKIKYW